MWETPEADAPRPDEILVVMAIAARLFYEANPT
jgi:hypothetical protein